MSSFTELLAQAQSRLNPYSGLALPDWVVKYRPHQLDAIDRILKAYSEVDMVVLDAPTGSGKTLIAETVRQVLGVSGVYMCTTKTLQDQVARDFPYGKVVKGRSNYPTELFPHRFGSGWNDISCGDCVKREELVLGEMGGEEVVKRCEFCSREDRCPYEIAKAEALYGDLAILNTSYFLTECNGPGRFSRRGLVIADECDVIEQELMRYVSVVISSRRMEQYGIKPPKFITKIESWVEWLEEYIPKIRGFKSKYPSGSLQDIREQKYLGNLYQKLVAISKGMDSDDQRWIYTGSKEYVEFKPIVVDSLGEDILWKNGKRWLLMSGSVISAQELLDSLGWMRDYRVVEMGSCFRPENRPVRVKPVATMSKAGKEAGEWERVIKGVEGIVNNGSGNTPTLVHTVSFDLARELEAGVNTNRPKIVYLGGEDRERALDRFIDEQESNPILFAASMDRGIDLVGDRCRSQIITKVPFPYLGDKQVNARLRGTRNGQIWYTVQTIRTILQMSGRIVRSEEDWGETWILDKQFSGLFNKYRHLFPEWWRKGLIWER